MHNRKPTSVSYQELVSDLAEQLKNTAYDQATYDKYKVKKYQLTNRDGEPVSAFVYDQHSKPYPRLEDFAEMRIRSLIEAAQLRFQKEGIPEAEGREKLQMIEGIAKDRLTQLKTVSFNQKDISTQYKEISDLIYQVLDNIAFHWAEAQPKNHAPSTKDYKAFFKNLRQDIEEVMPDYKKDQYLSINLDPAVRRFEYIERGTRQADDHYEQKAEKQNMSSHNRGKVGLANFGASLSGMLNEANELLVTSPVSFRTGCYMPIDFYAKTIPDGQPANYFMPETVSIASKNMLLLEEEIKARLDVNADANHPPTVTLVSVGLLTALADKENQIGIMSETALAFDRLRSRDDHFQPINFNFGVNFAAIYLKYYPEAQRFENHRSFAKLYDKTLESLAKAIPDPRGISSSNQSHEQKLLLAFQSVSQDYKKYIDYIENEIKGLAQNYDQALSAFEREASPSNRQRAIEAGNTLESHKMTLYERANNVMTLYQTRYDTVAASIDKELKAVNKNDLSPGEAAVHAALENFANINKLYYKEAFRENAHNFELQTHLLVLGDQLGVIDSLYPNQVGEYELCSSQFNCKSGNDRSDIQHKQKVLLYMSQDGHDILIKSDDNQNRRAAKEEIAKKVARSSAANEIPTQDSDGGASKGLTNKTDPKGPPDPEFARLMGKTSKWASKQLFKALLKNLSTDYQPLKQVFNAFPHLLQKNKEAIEKQLAKYRNEHSAKLQGQDPNNRTPTSDEVITKFRLLNRAVALINQYQASPQSSRDVIHLQSQVMSLKTDEMGRKRSGFFSSISGYLDNKLGKHPTSDLIAQLNEMVSDKAQLIREDKDIAPRLARAQVIEIESSTSRSGSEEEEEKVRQPPSPSQ